MTRPRSSVYPARVKLRALLAPVLFLAACDSQGSLPLDVEAKDGAMSGGKGDEIELVVKTVPGVDLRYGGQTVSTGDLATASFHVPKSGLKLGKNTFTVEATKGGALGKSKATATATWDAQPKGLLRFYSTGGDSEAALTCNGVMCGSSSFKATKAGKLPMEVESGVTGSLVVDGQKASASPGKRAPIEVDLLAKVAAAKVNDLDRVELAVELEAAGEKAKDTLDLAGPVLGVVAANALAQIDHGPVAFPGDGAAPADPHLLVAIGVPSSKLVVVGKTGTFRDVDLVAVAKPNERFFGCGKTDAAGIIYTDLAVTVYDRRTGKTVATRNLRADRVA